MRGGNIMKELRIRWVLIKVGWTGEEERGVRLTWRSRKMRPPLRVGEVAQANMRRYGTTHQVEPVRSRLGGSDEYGLRRTPFSPHLLW
ncbi:hypothetical protein L2E82_14594 [Cichorium intybus]|uniref:Uncharacterized protein n=1 Tax=Cichorium intybus TaxID=13427 RepID=A0ACB9F1A4_CICIN|nr:hypothetical protein L2E82_14594 [Cichorium intybus]